MHGQPICFDRENINHNIFIGPHHTELTETLGEPFILFAHIFAEQFFTKDHIFEPVIDIIYQEFPKSGSQQVPTFQPGSMEDPTLSL